jgi:hypothetical protein
MKRRPEGRVSAKDGDTPEAAAEPAAEPTETNETTEATEQTEEGGQ